MVAVLAIAMAQGKVCSGAMLTVPTPFGACFQSNPYNASPDNHANNVIPNPISTAPWDGSILWLWTGVGFTPVFFDSGSNTGFSDVCGNPVSAPLLTPGLGYIIFNGGGSPTSITYSGSVVPMPSFTFPVAAHPFAIGGPNGDGGALLSPSVLNFCNPDMNPGPLDGSFVELARYGSGHLIIGFAVAYFDSVMTDTTTGFVDTNGNPIPDPGISPGISPSGGFFFVNRASSAYTWKPQ